ncbi:MAG: Xaa-Pro peptidase family protein [Hydrogenobacter sp.]|uniref:M24 family metallopeptidase n=1 Tax=Hydrogenobacter thermophilus TaxID=940 RepID=UPI0030F8F626
MKLRKVKELVKKSDLDAFMISSPSNVFYLTGFRSSHAYVIITPDSHHLLTDARYYERAKSFLPEWDVKLIDQNAVKYIKFFLKELGAKRIGYEMDKVSCELKRSLRSKGFAWIGFSGFLKEMRAIKSKEEIGIMREGVKKSDLIYRKLLEFVKPGMREMDLRAFIVEEIFKMGASGESFPAIVASGEGSAIPHWETSQKKIESGKNLLIDMGLVWKGYCTDFTRTVFIGKADEEFRKAYQTVKDAHLFALDKVKVGNTLGDVDRAARKHIERKGFKGLFNHSTGHGIGIDIHEYPRVYYKGKDSKRLIQEGMVFTIEPGIYIPGKFGIRLENIVVVEDDVGKPMSEIDLDLIEL